MAMQKTWIGGILLAGIAVIAAMQPGCSALVFTNADFDDLNGNAGGETIIVRFRNYTVNEAVHVEFFTTSETTETLPDDLFVEENQVVRSIGLAGGGVIAPLTSDSITVDCTDGLVLGTTGGTFVDNETGDQQGTGTELWLQLGAQFNCGAEVTFEYRTDGEDGFETVLLLGQ